jgi:hypothetical protein
MKTLGQIAYESVNTKAFGYSWEAASAGTKKEYEFLAQAVRAAVIEECAKACDEMERVAAEQPLDQDDYSCLVYGAAAMEIRALKDKQ